MLEDLVSDLNVMLATREHSIDVKMQKLLHKPIGSYVLVGYNYVDVSEILELHLLTHDGRTVVKRFTAKKPLFSLSDWVFYNHLRDAVDPEYVMAS